MHTDSGVSEGPDGRQILKATALFYLNENWRDEDGGELQLYPFPNPPVRVKPKNGRLVIFEPRLVHEVLPNYRRRYCFTLWCAARETARGRAGTAAPLPDIETQTDIELAVRLSEEARQNSGEEIPQHLRVVPRLLRAFFLPEVRPLLVRYAFRHNEMQAAIASHEDGQQKDAMLAGIAEYHRRLAQNPHWLLDLLEAMPRVVATSRAEALQQSDREEASISAAAGDAALDACVWPLELAELVKQHCPWWT